jgi:hypothetical protein
MSDRIFIGYSRQDAEFVGRLVNDLSAAGVTLSEIMPLDRGSCEEITVGK